VPGSVCVNGLGVSRAMLSTYSHARMEAKRRALDEGRVLARHGLLARLRVGTPLVQDQFEAGAQPVPALLEGCDADCWTEGDFAPAIAWTDCGPSPKRQIQSTRRRYIANNAHWPNFRLGDHSAAIRKAWLLWAGLIRTREWSSYRFYVCTHGPKILGLDGLMRISSG
jgi:hypothetical protein